MSMEEKDSPTLVLHGDYAKSISMLHNNHTDELDIIPLDSPPKVTKHILHEESKVRESLSNLIIDYKEPEQNGPKNDDDNAY